MRGNERRDVVAFLLCQLRIDAVGVPKRKSLNIQGKSLAHDDLAAVIEALDLKEATLVGHSLKLSQAENRIYPLSMGQTNGGRKRPGHKLRAQNHRYGGAESIVNLYHFASGI